MNMSRRDALKTLMLGSGVALASSSLLSVANRVYAAVAKGEAMDLAFLKADQAKDIELMTHIILPKSAELPGAQDVAIVPFIDAVYAKLMSAEEQEKFLRGLSLVQKQFREEQGASFSQASEDARVSFISALYNLPESDKWETLKLIDLSQAPAGKEDIYHLYHFLFNLRALTLEGYFNSELVGESVTAYLPVPGPYDADMTIDENTRVWSIN
uniref:gluconate 2-dehydrogenase subunit 3 family protein n=1 Tax=Ningiella ruwaisensis TaxID=2364274 RepID=UPI00109FA38C|nr:gluconate 2-dehydrogenase subunit 3 family protein [Ningiella ruwaisensis]